MERAERELLRKHATELKQQPKSLKVSQINFKKIKFSNILFYFFNSTAKRASNS
jgi:hypothetical protein